MAVRNVLVTTEGFYNNDIIIMIIGYKCILDRRHFKQVKHLVQSKIRTEYNSYLQSVLGLSGEEGSNDTDKQSFAPKKLFSLIRNAKQDSHGVSPLMDKDSGIMFSQNKDKATLLNKQFQSVFSQLSPLKLSQLCIDKLQDYFFGRIPKKFQCDYPKMPEIIKRKERYS